ncbi:ABC transporter ATP-binding protein [Sphingopyxis sp.]|uniref:ABC transporter ATP-binding protein n=1 Tax=Sphingopyxis sp. TaxID=1908224 RepID=UPI002DF2CD75|nr:ABC transporter ATP-binding protein [Sphingopyxis sp.]
MTGAEPLVEVRDVTVRFGGIVALDGISFDIRPGELLGLIGPNGAGKTTLFNCLSRLYTPSSGDIRVETRSILGLPPHRMAALGLGRTFQNVALFDGLSVRDNVRIGTHSVSRSDPLSDALRGPWVRRRTAVADRKVDEILAWLELGAVADILAGDLPFGTRKRVEMARALASGPKLLMLDEPAAGLNRAEVDELALLLRRVRAESGVSVLLVEHNMGLVMGVSDRIVVLNFGRKIAEGIPSAIRDDPRVVEAYLGEAA